MGVRLLQGLIFEYDDLAYGRSLGATGHHENRLMALKWADTLYETVFRSLEVATTRTGMVLASSFRILPAAKFRGWEYGSSKDSLSSLKFCQLTTPSPRTSRGSVQGMVSGTFSMTIASGCWP